MSDFNATFAPLNACTLLNTGGTFALCECGEGRHHNSLRHLNKERRRRAKRTVRALCHGGAKNVLTSKHGRRGCGC
jgi:23S rRNA G2069 N7-methylase RlmK/C1962 C5-methylase RlmI